MTACVIVGLVVSCVVTDPKPTPAEAVRILEASRPVPESMDGGRYWWAWNDWRDYRDYRGVRWAVGARRLDGTRLDGPVTVYGGTRPYGGRGRGRR